MAKGTWNLQPLYTFSGHDVEYIHDFAAKNKIICKIIHMCMSAYEYPIILQLARLSVL